jgi:ubiquinone/menaquinone biosynthesis C-methylase UbiE
MAMAATGRGFGSRPCLIVMSHPLTNFSHFVWRAYSRILLALQPALFFQQLYGLDWYRHMLDDWFTWLGPSADSRILEAGCSSGGFSARMAQHGCYVTGVDRSVRAIRYAQRHQAGERLQFVIGDALQLPLQQQYHYSLAASLLNVVDTPRQLISELTRLTAANGVVSCLFPTLTMQRDAAQRYIDTQQLNGFAASALLLWARLAHKLDPAEVIQLFRDAGLNEVRSISLLEGMVAGVAARVSA